MLKHYKEFKEFVSWLYFFSPYLKLILWLLKLLVITVFLLLLMNVVYCFVMILPSCLANLELFVYINITKLMCYGCLSN